MSQLIPLTENEKIAYGNYSHQLVVDAARGDITQSTAATEQVITAFATKDQDQVRKVALILSESFQNTADAAYNTTTVRVGDQDDDDNFIAATEQNKNGTVVTEAYSSGDDLPKTYTGKKNILVTLGAQAGKKLSDLNKGRAVILFDLFRPTFEMKTRPAAGN